MKFSDLLRMSGSNLLRRKLRTALTVLGVVIGTASIVVMISLGLGLQKSSLEPVSYTHLDVYKRQAFTNVNDGTNEGLKYVGKNIFTVQYHPEACPGPQDSSYLFDRFLKMMEAKKNA